MFPHQPTTASTWAARLHTLAARGPAGARISDPRETFADELGHQRQIDAYLLAALANQSVVIPDDVSQTGDVALWRLAISDEGQPESILQNDGSASLLRHTTGTVIEVFTESELAGLHALWTVARRRGRNDLSARCLSAAAWHLDELQPDNATHLPWAIHVFVILALTSGRADAMLDAETRLHNALTGAGGGRPDTRSAMILEHAARELDHFASRPPSTM